MTAPGEHDPGILQNGELLKLFRLVKVVNKDSRLEVLSLTQVKLLEEILHLLLSLSLLQLKIVTPEVANWKVAGNE